MKSLFSLRTEALVGASVPVPSRSVQEAAPPAPPLTLSLLFILSEPHKLEWDKHMTLMCPDTREKHLFHPVQLMPILIRSDRLDPFPPRLCHAGVRAGGLVPIASVLIDLQNRLFGCKSSNVICQRLAFIILDSISSSVKQQGASSFFLSLYCQMVRGALPVPFYF